MRLPKDKLRRHEFETQLRAVCVFAIFEICDNFNFLIQVFLEGVIRLPDTFKGVSRPNSPSERQISIVVSRDV